MRRGTLWAAPFDLDRLTVSGPEVAMIGSVAQSLSSYHSYDVNGAGQFAVSSSGTLAWLSASAVARPARELVMVDRTGQAVALPMARQVDPTLELQDVHISPDGRHLFIGTEDPREMNVWIYNLTDGRVRPAIHDGEAQWPAWSPDGRLFFNWLKDGRRSLAFVPGDTDGTIPPQPVESGTHFIWPATFTPDGHLIAVQDDREIVVVTVEHGQARVEPVHEASRAEAWPALSADGRWLAYGASLTDRTDATVQSDVYVRRFPGGGPAVPVSTGGGRNPAWNPNGGELFYVTTPDSANRTWVMAARFTPGSPPAVGTPTPLFEITNSALAFGGEPLFNFCVAPDGQHFYTTRRPGASTFQQRPPPATHINLIPNWVEDLRSKVPVK
jgi:dipeptidyl aminopeptidase/acylaminoacyl peptidase